MLVIMHMQLLEELFCIRCVCVSVLSLWCSDVWPPWINDAQVVVGFDRELTSVFVFV